MSKERDKIAESNKKLVLATLSGVAIIVAICASVLFLTPLGDYVKERIDAEISKTKPEEQAPETVANSAPTFEARITEFLNELTKSGSLNRAGLGIRYVTITDEIATTYNLPVKEGAFIPSEDAIIEGMPAAKAGLKAGDIIIEIDNTKITAENPLNYVIAKHAIGDTVQITYLRNNLARIVTAKLAKLKA